MTTERGVIVPQVFERDGMEILDLETIPIKYRGTYEKALRGKASPRRAIRAKCFECNGFENPAVRTKECAVFGCPLWAYRPGV